MDSPLTVEVYRGTEVESRHEVDVVVVDAAGTILERWGDATRPVFPRSALKPIQGLALVRSAAADRWALGPAELALACGSHA
ncbi:MAG: asparaginase [Acidimicrobiales bacterium]